MRANGDAVQLAAYRRMTGTERAEIMFRLSALAREAAIAGIRKRHPEYDHGQVVRALARLLYGDELVRGAWPGLELLEP